jgi:hypothetical protein
MPAEAGIQYAGESKVKTNSAEYWIIRFRG